MSFKFSAIATFQRERLQLKDVARSNILTMVLTLETSHFDKSLSKLMADLNVFSMLVTLEVFHLDRLPLNAEAPSNAATPEAKERTPHAKTKNQAKEEKNKDEIQSVTEKIKKRIKISKNSNNR
jgi:hypothetical protein